MLSHLRRETKEKEQELRKKMSSLVSLERQVSKLILDDYYFFGCWT